MNNTTEINELNRVINSLTCQIKGIAGESDSLRHTIDEQHTQINSLAARVWDAECKVIKISDVVGGTDPYYRSTVMESIAAIVADIPVGSAIQTDGVAAELDSLRTNSEKWEREAHRLMEVITGNAIDIGRLTMNINEALAQLQDWNITKLNIYWLEENEEGHEYWWCDVINDDLCDLCKANWIWTVMSRVERENEERHDLTMEEDDDWFIIVDEEKFSNDLISDHIKWWLRDRGFNFEVEVIDSVGTKGEKQMLDAIEDASGD
jgi:hypothetical protein